MERMKVKVPENLRVTALMSCGFNIVVSVVYAVLYALAIFFRFACDKDSIGRGSRYFLNIVYKTYIQDDSCGGSLRLEGITPARAVFTLSVISLCLAVACVLMASVFIAIMQTDEKYHLNMFGYAYIGFCCGSLVVDVTFASHFGMDHSYLKDVLDQSPVGSIDNYPLDVLRLGSLILMSILLKGYFGHAINIVLLIQMGVFLVEFQNQLQRNEHSIHKMGALNAYEQQRKQEEWPQPPEMAFARASQLNPSFIEDEPPRSPVRDNRRSDYNNPAYDRSTSWSHSQPAPSARPFSYLEDIKRTVPVKPPISPSFEPQWRNDNWSQPPVPAPDYSPPTGRRLKPALKSYM